MQDALLPGLNAVSRAALHVCGVFLMTETMAVTAPDNHARRERISSLLLRYPELLGSEPPIETALLTCEENVAAKAKQFLNEHAKATSRGLEAPLVVVVFVLLAVVIMFALAFHLPA